MRHAPAVPDLTLAASLDSLFRQALPVYDNLDEFSMSAMLRSLARAHTGKPLHEAVLAEVDPIIAIEAPGLRDDIIQQLRVLDDFPVDTPTNSFIAVYSGYRLVCDWLDPRNDIIPSMAGMRGTAKYLRMLATIGSLQDRGVTITFKPGSSQPLSLSQHSRPT